MNIHYSQTLVFEKYFFENHVHTLIKLPFYTGPKDMADPVKYLKASDARRLARKNVSNVPYSELNFVF